MSIDERERVHRKFQETFDKIEGHAEFIEGLRYHIYGSEADQDEIFTYYKKAAELSKVPSIQYMVGMFYLKGLGTESSRTLARKWFLLSAENGCADAQYSLWRLNYEEARRCCFCGIEEGLKWLKKAAESGLPKAEHDYGVNYLEGEIVDTDEEKGFAWVLKAAEKGHLNAQYITSGNYMFGIGVEKDEKKGFEWLSIAASHDYPPAVYGVGRCYELGLGVAQDFDKAYDWFVKASLLKEPDAFMCLMEDDVVEDEEEDEEI